MHFQIAELAKKINQMPTCKLYREIVGKLPVMSDDEICELDRQIVRSKNGGDAFPERVRDGEPQKIRRLIILAIMINKANRLLGRMKSGVFDEKSLEEIQQVAKKWFPDQESERIACYLIKLGPNGTGPGQVAEMISLRYLSAHFCC